MVVTLLGFDSHYQTPLVNERNGMRLFTTAGLDALIKEVLTTAINVTTPDRLFKLYPPSTRSLKPGNVAVISTDAFVHHAYDSDLLLSLGLLEILEFDPSTTFMVPIQTGRHFALALFVPEITDDKYFDVMVIDSFFDTDNYTPKSMDFFISFAKWLQGSNFDGPTDDITVRVHASTIYKQSGGESCAMYVAGTILELVKDAEKFKLYDDLGWKFGCQRVLPTEPITDTLLHIKFYDDVGFLPPAFVTSTRSLFEGYDYDTVYEKFRLLSEDRIRSQSWHDDASLAPQRFIKLLSQEAISNVGIFMDLLRDKSGTVTVNELVDTVLYEVFLQKRRSPLYTMGVLVDDELVKAVDERTLMIMAKVKGFEFDLKQLNKALRKRLKEKDLYTSHGILFEKVSSLDEVYFPIFPKIFSMRTWETKLVHLIEHMSVSRDAFIPGVRLSIKVGPKEGSKCYLCQK